MTVLLNTVLPYLEKLPLASLQMVKHVGEVHANDAESDDGDVESDDADRSPQDDGDELHRSEMRREYLPIGVAFGSEEPDDDDGVPKSEESVHDGQDE